MKQKFYLSFFAFLFLEATITQGSVMSVPVANFYSSDTAFCDEAGRCINFFDLSTGSPTSWQWSFPGASPATSTQQNPDSICYYIPGTYPVTLIVGNGSGSDTLVVSPLIIFANPPLPPTITISGFCIGDTLLSSYAAHYQWYLNGSPIAGDTSQICVITQSGTYDVVITDTYGCTSLSNGILLTGCTMLLTLNQSNPILCAGGSCTLNVSVSGGTPPYSYLWNTGSTTSSITCFSLGIYSVYVTDFNSSTNIASITVTEPLPLLIAVTAVNATCSACNDGSATVSGAGGTPPYSIWWSNSQITFTATNLSAGAYSVCVTDANACSLCDSVILGVGTCSAVFTLTPDTAILHHYFAVNTATGVAPLTYLWSWGDGTTDTAAYPNHTYASAGNYSICLTITDAMACTNSYCYSSYLHHPNNTMISVTVIPSLITGVVNESSFYQTLKLFPNPTNGSVAIAYSLPKSSNVVIEVYNSYGQLVKEISNEKQSSGRQETVFDSQKLAAGIYFVKVIVDGNATVLKMAKM